MKAIKDKEINKINNGILSAVSHELRTPLAAIKGYSSMLLDYYTEFTAEETKEYIQSIDNATDMMTRLVDDLLDSSRLEEGRLDLEKASINIIDLIMDAVKEAEARDKNHEILTAINADLPKIRIDPQRVRHVLDNLMNNAARLSPQGTEILISATANGKEMEICVTSRDRGVPDSEFCNINELLYRMENANMTGVNATKFELYVSEQLVQAHGGRMWAESSVGIGTTIKFTLPLTHTA